MNFKAPVYSLYLNNQPACHEALLTSTHLYMPCANAFGERCKFMTEEQTKQDDKYKWLIIALVIVFLFWLASYPLATLIISNWDDRGTFGDTFGAINALFSGFAFAGIVYTIILQKKELELQRLELIDTRKELSRAADAHEKSEKAQSAQFRIQQFERILFEATESHKKLLIDLELDEFNSIDSTQHFGFKKATDNLIRDTYEYSRQLQTKFFTSRKFLCYIPDNPVSSFQLGHKVINEYLESFLFLLDILEDSPDTKTKLQLSKFIYHKLNMNEKFLIGYMLEMDINKRITSKGKQYEELFKLHYLSTQFPLKKGAENPPKFHITFEETHQWQYSEDRFVLPNKGTVKFRADHLFPGISIHAFSDKFEIRRLSFRLNKVNTQWEDGSNLTMDGIIESKPEGNYFSLDTALKTVNLMPEYYEKLEDVYHNFNEQMKNVSGVSIYIQLRHFDSNTIFDYSLPLSVRCDRHIDGKVFFDIRFL